MVSKKRLEIRNGGYRVCKSNLKSLTFLFEFAWPAPPRLVTRALIAAFIHDVFVLRPVKLAEQLREVAYAPHH